MTGGTRRPALRAGWLSHAGRTLAAALSVLALVPAAAQAQVAIDSMEIASVRFPGASAISPKLLATAVVTGASECYAVKPLCWLGLGVDRQYLDPRVLPVDSLRLWFVYYQHGYREAAISVDTSRQGERVGVTFHVAEGRPVLVDSVTFAGSDSLPREITRNLPLRRGGPLDITVYQATRDTIKSRLRNRGFAGAEVLAGYTILTDRPYDASVHYEIDPGPRMRFGTIEVVGAQKVDSSVVRRMLTFRSGDVFSSAALLQSQRNLFAQEVFRHADIRELRDPFSTDTLVDIRVQVNEGDIHRVRSGAGVSTAEYLNLEGRWTSRSFQGGARRLEVSGRVTNLFTASLAGLPGFEPAGEFYGKISGSLTADFTQPWFFGPLNTLGAGLFLERRSIPDVFRRQGGGGSITFSRTLGSTGSFTIGYRPELTQIQAPDGDFIFCAGFTACGPGEISALSQKHWLSPLTFSISRDRSNSIFTPTRGYSVRLDAELASRATGSDFGYSRIAAEYIDYHTFTTGLVGAVRLKPGIALALTSENTLGVHPQKRFFAGGANSVRGFAQYRLGPKLLIVDALDALARPVADGGAGCDALSINDGTCDARDLAARDPGRFQVQPVGGAVAFEGNVELRFPVWGDNLRGAAFLDFGQVWSDRDAVDFSRVVATPGLGIRYYSPIGPIRVDLGYYGGRGETVTVVTTELCVRTGADCVVPVPGVEYDPTAFSKTRVLRTLDMPVLWNTRTSFLDRLQIHLSIGQAF
ncbi:MAG: BamA/TamA family outer membrane protein [Gemmatimonadota bacterium]|jgi:outer membrane protein assembly factor BamA